MAAKYELNLDLKPNGIPQKIHLNQYDKGQTITVHLYNDDAVYTPVGKVWVSGTKKDNTGFQYQCVVSGSNVIITVTNQMTCFYGDTEVEVADVKEGMVQGSANFILSVEEAAFHDDTIISETDIPAVQIVAENIDKIEQWKNEAGQSAANAKNSENVAVANANAAKASADSAASSASKAWSSETNSRTSETNAKDSETNAKKSEENAKKSEENAKKSEENAAESEKNTKKYADDTKTAIVSNGYANLYIKQNTGHLYLFRTETAKKHLDFALADHKNLLVTMIS